MEKKLEKALEIIEDLDWETVECGTYTVDDDIFYMVQEYETKHPFSGCIYYTERRTKNQCMTR